MKAYLLDEGYNALIAQATSGDKLQFSRFQVGSSLSTGGNQALAGAAGTVWFTGSASDMAISPFTSEQVDVWCQIEHDDPTGVIGNVVLFVTLGSVEYAFMLLEPVAGMSNVKLKTSVHKVGMHADLHLLMTFPNLLDRFDFSNLTQFDVGWLEVDTELEVPHSFTTLHDQMVIAEHSELGRPVLALNLGNRWMACPILFTLADSRWTDAAFIDGGAQGDGYLYEETT